MVIFYIVGMITGFFMITGWYFAYMQGEYPDLGKDDYYIDLLTAVLYGLLMSLGWFITIPLEYVLSERAKHGWKIG